MLLKIRLLALIGKIPKKIYLGIHFALIKVRVPLDFNSLDEFISMEKFMIFSSGVPLFTECFMEASV